MYISVILTLCSLYEHIIYSEHIQSVKVLIKDEKGMRII